jgi:hypothetical protein
MSDLKASGLQSETSLQNQNKKKLDTHMTISGLLTVKPANTPKVGDIRCYAVENRVAQSGKEWTKVKGSSPDNGGQSYKVISVRPTGRTDQHGNISLNVEIEPSSGSVSGVHAEQRGPAQVGAASTRNGDDRSSRIERQHSQEMALRYWSLLARGGALSPEDCKDTQKLRAVIDWFQRDVSHSPSAPVKQPEPVAPYTPYDPSDGSPDDEEIPF